MLAPKKQDWVKEKCAKEGLRWTKGLEEVVKLLGKSCAPLPLSDIQSKLEGKDQATIYRIVHRLTEVGVLRELGMHGRSSYFVLNQPNHHHDYLICRNCGEIEVLHGQCELHKIEKEIEKTKKYSQVYHELEFYGICPKCV
jgi:Fe2+ or Zn2+ uptake regulation protein